jgi:diguanylate cyclase (GGDEF)-like protein
MEQIDIENLSHLQTHLSRLTGLTFSILGENGEPALPPVKEKKILAALKSSPDGRRSYDDFVRKSIEKTRHRSGISIFKDPAGMYHFFVPLGSKNAFCMLMGEGIYLSTADYESFYRREAHRYGIPPQQLNVFSSDIVIKSYKEIEETAQSIYQLSHLLLSASYKSRINEKRYRMLKIIMSLLSDVSLEKLDESFDTLIDIMLFLFYADSISIMTRENSLFTPQKADGSLKDYLETVQFKGIGIVSDVIEKKHPVYTESVMDIFQLGYSEVVTSIYVFPIISGNKVVGILCIFNTNINQDDADIISEICRITGFLFRLKEIQNSHSRHMKEFDILNVAAARITPAKDPEMLYDAILDTSVHLAEADKGSLMLLDDDASYLTVKAAKGINKRLLGEIRIRVGEGIAGKVFSNGKPCMIDNIDTCGIFASKRKPKYKTGSFISIPLKAGDQIIGVLNISDKITGEIFSKDDMILLRSFASYASIALERSAYYSLAGHLRELSITDSLTGLFNRRYFEERFLEEIHRSNRHNLEFSMAMIDIDDFKLFNDSEGHLAADEVLKCIANIAKDCLRISDVIARFGGEEFAVIMPQTSKSEALSVAERIRGAVKQYLPCTWKIYPRLTITISTGIATFPADGKDQKELIRNADRALYMAKMQGKDRTIVLQK